MSETSSSEWHGRIRRLPTAEVPGCAPPARSGWRGRRAGRRRAAAARVGVAVSCLALLLSGLASPALADAIARGDEAFLRRAEGGSDGRAAPEPIGEAIRAYQEALAADPLDLEARWKLLRALHFEGEFAREARDAKRRIFDQARILSDQGVALLAERLGGGDPLHELSSDALRERLAQGEVSPGDVAGFYFWSAVNWAAWSQTSGLLGAVRRGVANRLHDYTLLVVALEPEIEEGGAHRLLSALHARLPRVPLLSGWVDRSQALPEAERALAIAPEHPGNHLLLAITLLDLHPERREEALALLEEVAVLEPRGAQEVEDLAVRREARERLARERAPAGEQR